MRNNDTSVTPAQGAGHAKTTSIYGRLSKAGQRFFAKILCKIKSFAYLCIAKKLDYELYKVIRTLFERVPVALLRSQSWFLGGNTRGTLYFYIN